MSSGPPGAATPTKPSPITQEATTNNARPYVRSLGGSVIILLGIASIIFANLGLLTKIFLSGKTMAETSDDKLNQISFPNSATDHASSVNGESANQHQNSSKEVSAAMDFWWMSSLKNTQLSLASVKKNDDYQENSQRTLVFPSHTKRLWIDVGVHEESDFIDNLKNESDLFLIGFEPSSKWKPCLHPQCITLWAACTPTYDATVTLNIQAGNDLCNSILPPQTNTTSRLWKGCVTQQNTSDGSKRVMNVPGVPLSELIQRVPSSVVVELVKIDAQGYDLEVMKGMLSVSKRVQVVVMEAMDVKDPKQLLYMGQPMLSQIVEFLAKKGWKHVTSVDNKGVAGEVNAFFVYDDQYAPKVEQFAKYFQKR
jgi:hypothetical protein